MAALTQVSRVSIQQPDKYNVPWLPLYGLSVVMLLGVGAKKILRPRHKPNDVTVADADKEIRVLKAVLHDYEPARLL